MIINIGNRRKPKTTNKEQVELTQHISHSIPAYLSYTKDNKEHKYTGEIYKNANGYTGILKETEQYPVEMEVKHTYNGDDIFSYVDKDGYERTFNKFETLHFDEETNTYMGVITEVNYEDSKIEIFECEE